MRKLDLQRAFFGFGAAPKDFQNQAGAVEHLGVPGLLEIALLDRRQRAIHHHQFDVLPGDKPDTLLALSPTESGPSPDLAHPRSLSRCVESGMACLSVCASGSPRRIRK